jgi:hypothetical protein
MKADDVNLQKETEAMLINDKGIEKNIELINKGEMDTVTKQQELRTEVVKVDTVRSLEGRHLHQQLDVRRHRKLKKQTQGNGVSCKKLEVVH